MDKELENCIFYQWRDRFHEFCGKFSDADYILCPCTDFANIESHEVVDVQMHLVSRGFMDGYTRWTRHGEEEVMDEDTQGSKMPNPD